MVLLVPPEAVALQEVDVVKQPGYQIEWLVNTSTSGAVSILI